jgi:predicted metal-dependent hydrolase
VPRARFLGVAGVAQAKSPVNSGVATLRGERVSYTLRRSRRTRRLHIRILPTGVEVVLPMRARVEDARAFLADNADWVLRHLQALRQKGWLREAGDASGIKTLLLRGRWMQVMVDARPASLRVMTSGDTLTLTLPVGREAQAGRILEDWLRRQAGDDIAERVRLRSAQMGVSPRRVFIRNQRTKWGNCSSLGNVSFNWRLIGAPPEVLDYVVVHELAHLKEMNHSARFWTLVRAYCPDFARHKAWLKANDGCLMVDF